MLLHKIDQLHSGQVVYRGCYAPNMNYAVVNCFTLQLDPYYSSKSGNWWVDGKAETIYFGGSSGTGLSYDEQNDDWSVNPYHNSGVEHFSTKDAGVEQDPRYNHHALFDTLADAIRHVEAMAAGDPPPTGGHNILTVLLPQPQEDESDTDAYDRAMGPV